MSIPSGTIPPGKRLGPYEVVAPIAEGGMGVVYRAHDRTLDRTVALKVLSSTVLLDATFAERFNREAQLWARLEHPCVVPVYLAGIEDGRPFIAMRFIEGGSLDHALRAGPIVPERAFRILADTARALDFAHAQGIVHRDVKPGNVLVDGDGRAYLSDFGIARAIAGDASVHLTAEVVGTPAYMSPEQARSQNPGPLADIYSLGCLAYEALTGRPPFEGDSAIQVLMRHVSEEPAPPRTHVPDLPAHTQEAILKAMAKDPSERWPTAGVFVQALTGSIDVNAVHTISLPGRMTMVSGAPPTPASTPRPAPRKTRPWLLAGAGVVLAGAMAALGFWLHSSSYDPFFPQLTLGSSAPTDERVAGLVTAISRLLDAGDYSAADDTAAAALTLHPRNQELQTLQRRVRSAWEAEKALGLWVEPMVVAVEDPVPTQVSNSEAPAAATARHDRTPGGSATPEKAAVELTD